MRERVYVLFRYLGTALFFGLLYAALCRHGFAVPCPIRLVTGLRCPGCGVTHLCLHLLQFRFREAFYDNQAVFLLLPVFAAMAARRAWLYVRTGQKRLSKAENGILMAASVLLILFGIVRNLLFTN